MKNKITVAAIDIGTNSIHMIVADLDNTGKISLIHRKREVVRLGEDTFSIHGSLSESAIVRAIATLKKFKSVAVIFKAVIITCATSAVREALNGLDFIQRIKNELDLDVELIDGNEEANLIYQGIVKALDLENHLTFAIDIGGGSTEFILGNNNNVIYSKSIPIGAVRLTKMFFEGGTLSDESISNCYNYISETIYNEVFEAISTYKIEKYVGTSGTIFSTFLILEKKEAGAYLESLNGGIIKRPKLIKLEKLILSKKTIEERLTIKGLENKRADIYPAGIMILAEIFRIFNIECMAISTYAMREGMIINYGKKLNSSFEESL